MATFEQLIFTEFGACAVAPTFTVLRITPPYCFCSSSTLNFCDKPKFIPVLWRLKSCVGCGAIDFVTLIILKAIFCELRSTHNVKVCAAVPIIFPTCHIENNTHRFSLFFRSQVKKVLTYRVAPFAWIMYRQLVIKNNGGC